MLRFLTAGESHGPAEVAILEGIPSGLTLAIEDIQTELEKRRGGAGRGGRGKIETDRVEILSGVRFGKTIGSPIALTVRNLDFENWKEIMKIEPDISRGVYSAHLRGVKKITHPRPGHADLAGAIKYGFDDIRNVLERASARETIMRVAVGAVCKKLLKEFGIEILSHTIRIGSVILTMQPHGKELITRIRNKNLETGCINPEVSHQMKEEIKKALLKKDTLGGIIEIMAVNVPPGLGSYIHWDRRLDGRISQSLMSIPSVKAIEIGDGTENSQKYGSEVQDEIFCSKRLNLKGGSTSQGGYYHKANRAGGIEGGVSNGENIVVRVFHKPISTIGNPLNTIDIKTGKAAKAVIERSDICVVPRAGVISEAGVAFCLADTLLEKFGADNLSHVKYNFKGYLRKVRCLSNLSDL